jgi:transcriptional/translational regulatory protein YebC/TACO1
MQKELEKAGIEAENAELQRIPNTYVAVELEDAKKVMRMINLLEDDDDVQAVYHNMEMSDELLDE